MSRSTSVAYRVNATPQRFTVHFFENRDFKPGGNEWVLTQDGWQTPEPPNDEIAAFKLVGDPGVHLELFNDIVVNYRKTWGEATLTSAVTRVDVPNLRHATGVYVYHKAKGDDDLDGKVSLIQVSGAK